jgi:hypothetical protein
METTIQGVTAMATRIPRFAIMALGTALAACSTVPRQSDPDRLALYMSQAGAPIQGFRYLDPIGWDRIDDRHLVLDVRPRESYLLTLGGPCLGWSSSAPVISISHTDGISVSTRFDTVSVLEPNPVSCRIDEIRPVDMVDVRAARDRLEASAP